LSIGQTNGVRVRNAGRFNTGIKITVPEIFFGSSVYPIGSPLRPQDTRRRARLR
jgi:hypothetical protein